MTPCWRAAARCRGFPSVPRSLSSGRAIPSDQTPFSSPRPPPSSERGPPRSEVAVFVAGLPFRVETAERLTQAERQALLSMADPRPPEEDGDHRAFRIVLEPGTAVRAASPSAARISWSQGLCLLDHAAFRAEIEPFRKEARVFRGDASALGLVTTLRVALACWLPLEGGLVLHAAGIEREGAGIAFHGASGAGKTTLAACSPWPVLSDELVALVPDGS